jgi:sulfate permease, SulP family
VTLDTAGDAGARWQRLLPGVGLMRRYERGWLRGDVLAGVTVTAYLLPQVMAYAEVAGLPAVVGLWASVAALLVYAVFGSSPQLSVGPESTTALMTATALGGLAAGKPERYAALAAALAGLVGLFCLVAWAARLGFLADLLSRPVLVGYMSGVAVLMIISQLGKLTGLSVEGDTPLAEIAFVLGHLSEADATTFLLAMAVLTFLLVGARLFPRTPVPLIGMLLAAGVVVLFDLQDNGVTVVGPVPRELPSLQLPAIDVGDLRELFPAALGITIVAFTDNILTARAFETRHAGGLDSNQELLALGAANLAVGAAQGFPVSSSGSRTAIGDAMGSRSQLYSLVALGSVVLTVLFLGPVLAAFPSAALGAVVVYAAVRLVDVPEFRRIGRFRRIELALALGTTVAVLALGVLQGVLVAVALSVLDLLYRVTRPHDGILGYVPGVAGMHDIDDYADAQPVPGLVVYRYDSPLFFANAQDFTRRALAAIDSSPTPTRWFLLNAEANTAVDVTAVDALEAVREEVARRGIIFAMARVKQDLRDDLQRAGLIDRVGESRIFMTLPTAVNAYVEWSIDTLGKPPEGFNPPP